jgi:hypothetical protein
MKCEISCVEIVVNEKILPTFQRLSSRHNTQNNWPVFSDLTNAASVCFASNSIE